MTIWTKQALYIFSNLFHLILGWTVSSIKITCLEDCLQILCWVGVISGKTLTCIGRQLKAILRVHGYFWSSIPLLLVSVGGMLLDAAEGWWDCRCLVKKISIYRHMYHYSKLWHRQRTLYIDLMSQDPFCKVFHVYVCYLVASRIKQLGTTPITCSIT